MKFDIINKRKEAKAYPNDDKMHRWNEEINEWKDNLTLKAQIDLQNEINSAKKFLADTDFKMLPNYVPKPDEDIEALVAERNAKREFIRLNEND